jgi:hypothetical protein
MTKIASSARTSLDRRFMTHYSLHFWCCCDFFLNEVDGVVENVGPTLESIKSAIKLSTCTIFYSIFSSNLLVVDLLVIVVVIFARNGLRCSPVACRANWSVEGQTLSGGSSTIFKVPPTSCIYSYSWWRRRATDHTASW